MYVSLAYRRGQQELGGNWQIELVSESPITPLRELLTRVKGWIDHRCLWVDVEEFKHQPSTPEAVALWLKVRLPEVLEVRVHESKTWCFVATSSGFCWQAHVNNLWAQADADLDAATGLAVDREAVAQRIVDVAACLPEMNEKSWCEQLYRDLQLQVPKLQWIRVDLSRHSFLEHHKT